MSSTLRRVLLCGCALVAGLEAPDAGAWLRAGLSDPYALPAAPREDQVAAARAGKSPIALPMAPLLLTLAPVQVAGLPPLAVER